MAQKLPMKWIAVGIIVLVVLILVSVVWGSYNSLVGLNQNVDKSFADVQAQYQRRFDLIPNIVSTVGGAANFEKSTLTEITQLRSQWQTAQTPEQSVQTANQFESALSRLLLISENYPDLTATQNFRSLQDSLTETENMVSVARTRYNSAVRDYNAAVQYFPSNIIAGWFGFMQRSYFTATDAAGNTVPQVNFTF